MVASTHLSNDATSLTNVIPLHTTNQITISNGQTILINSEGKGILPTPSHKLLISQVIHTPHLP